jgi:hypothetical protein
MGRGVTCPDMSAPTRRTHLSPFAESQACGRLVGFSVGGGIVWRYRANEQCSSGAEEADRVAEDIAGRDGVEAGSAPGG